MPLGIPRAPVDYDAYRQQKHIPGNEQYWLPKNPNRKYEPGWEAPPHKRDPDAYPPGKPDYSDSWPNKYWGGYQPRTPGSDPLGRWGKDRPEGENPFNDNPVIDEDPANPKGPTKPWHRRILKMPPIPESKELWENRIQQPKLPGLSLGAMEQYRLEPIEMTDLGQSAAWADQVKESLEKETGGHWGYGDAAGGHGSHGPGRGAIPGYRGGGGGGGGGYSGGEGADASATGGGSPYLAHTRAGMFSELDKDPALRRDVIKTASMEGGLQSNIEQMSNYAQMRGFTSLRQAIHSGFYGPVNRGGLRGGLSASQQAAGEKALAAVRGGSNIIGFRTDQGLWSDPNGAWYRSHPDQARHAKVQGANFFDFRGRGPAWAAQQRSAEQQYNRSHPSDAITERTPEQRSGRFSGSEPSAAGVRGEPGGPSGPAMPDKHLRWPRYSHEVQALKGPLHRPTQRHPRLPVSHSHHMTLPHRNFAGHAQTRPHDASAASIANPYSRSYAGVQGLPGSPSGPVAPRPPKPGTS